LCGISGWKTYPQPRDFGHIQIIIIIIIIKVPFHLLETGDQIRSFWRSAPIIFKALSARGAQRRSSSRHSAPEALSAVHLPGTQRPRRSAPAIVHHHGPQGNSSSSLWPTGQLMSRAMRPLASSTSVLVVFACLCLSLFLNSLSI